MENRICDLPDDLILEIMNFIPTKDAVATTILSKRWRLIWTMLPTLEYKDSGSGIIGWFVEKSLQLHKAPKLERLTIELGPHSHVDVDVEKCLENAVNRGVHELDLNLLWNAEITSFPKSLHTCDTLVDLVLSNKILVDVPSQVDLPSLLYLSLIDVVYKDEDSLAGLLSSSSVLHWLMVQRRKDDNLTNFTVKVSSLKTLYYKSAWPMDEPVEEGDDDDDDLIGSLVIDTPALDDISLITVCEDCCLIDNMSCLDEANISHVIYPDDKFLKSLSSVKHLHLCLTNPMVGSSNDVKFSRLIEFYFLTKTVDWLEPLMFFLQNSAQLKFLTIHTEHESPSPPWNQPSSIPGCLSSHLEIFVWNNYEGRDDEKQLLSYILANSECLKRAEINLIATCNLEERQKEIQSMPRISTSSRLLFPTQMKNLWFNGYC
ncbi:putative F-box/FBD/LRR-repeat protein At1g22000 [Raphanus sativus]|uniref:F-box/FBD/LRR-repeat protein At1g22000 n=1 Tax=Raphanus sativus TaxID=3726 RepID=A0A6J0JPS2_RAPSA|nr:putative F-box/FBD/LRR-repeat protein At1g22000 [Raphanus sativus]